MTSVIRCVIGVDMTSTMDAKIAPMGSIAFLRCMVWSVIDAMGGFYKARHLSALASRAHAANNDPASSMPSSTPPNGMDCARNSTMSNAGSSGRPNAV